MNRSKQKQTIQSPKQENTSTHFALLIFSLTLVLVSRLLPFLKGPLSTYGYDFGFYFYAAKHATAANWQDLLTAFWGGFNNPLFYFFNLLHIPAEISLSFSYIFFSLFLGLSLYWFFAPRNRKAGLIALLLYAVSMIQMESYLMFLYKNALALPFMILGFRFLMFPKKPNGDGTAGGKTITILKSYWPFLLCTLLIILTHRTTAIIYLLTAGLYILWMLIKSKRYLLLSLLLTSCFLLLISWYFFFNLKSLILNLVNNNNYYVRTGLFLPYENPLFIIWPLAMLAIPGLIIYFKNKHNSLPIFFLALSLLWIIFQLPFYKRMWIYFDLSLIIFAAYFLSATINQTLVTKKSGRTFWSLAIILIFIFFSHRFVNFTLNKTPLITPTEVAELKNFSYPPGMILALSANDAPWLLAYTNGSRLGAPGLLEDPHTFEEWNGFWTGSGDQVDFISKYPRPLYFYQRDWQMHGGLAKCFIPLSKNFSQYNYECAP